MPELTTATENTIRLAGFLVVLAVMMAWEFLAPRRPLTARRPWRWTSNLAFVVLNTVLARLLIPVTAMGAAMFVEGHQWGVLRLIPLPDWARVTLAVVALDLVIYLQHVMFHAVPRLWRLHLVHHADLDIDVTTGIRFHTLEILISALIKLGAVVLIGVPPLAVLIFEVLLNATSMFNHSNVRMPGWLDRILRLVVVTPDMHRVHHSIVRRETNSNFGFNLPWWDWIFGTYRAQPAAGHDQMTIGLEGLRDEGQVDRLPGMLWLPFSAPAEEELSPRRDNS